MKGASMTNGELADMIAKRVFIAVYADKNLNSVKRYSEMSWNEIVNSISLPVLKDKVTKGHQTILDLLNEIFADKAVTTGALVKR